MVLKRATRRAHDTRLPERSRLVGSAMPNQWHMLSSSVTEEYDHAGSSECDPRAQASAVEQGEGDGGKAAAATQTRVVTPDETPDLGPRPRPRHVQSSNR